MSSARWPPRFPRGAFLHGAAAAGMFLKIIVGLVYVIGGMSQTLPLIVAEAAAFWHMDLSWRWLVDVVLTVLATWCVLYCGLMIIVESQYIALVRRFLLQFRNCRFTRMKLEDYLPSLAREKERLTVLSLMRDSPGQRYHAVPRRLAPATNVQIVLLEWDPARPGPKPNTLTAYPGMHETTIFVSESAESIGGVQRYMLLHEIGHATAGGRTGNMTSRLGMIAPFLAGPLLLAKVEFSVAGILLVVALMAASRLIHRFVCMPKVGRSQLADEVSADCFAIHHSDPEWLSSVPCQWLARQFRSDGNLEESDRPVRERLLIENLERRQKGLPPNPRLDKTIAAVSLWEFTVPILIIACGLQHAAPSAVRLTINALLTFCFFLLALGLTADIRTQEREYQHLFENTDV